MHKFLNMADDFIQGFDEFEENLRKLELSVRRRVLLKAANAGADVLIPEASSRAPRGETGNLAAGITKRNAGRESDANEGSVDVGPSRKQYYGLFQEVGTVHNAAQPFLKNAMDANEAKISEAMRDVLWDEIQGALVQSIKQPKSR